MAEKIFIGNARFVEGEKNGSKYKFMVGGINLDSLPPSFPMNGWLNFKISRKRNNEGKNTHYIELNTYENPQQRQQPQREIQINEDLKDEDMPF